MNAYKFDVRIGNDGVINLPHLLNLINQDAEVIVVPKNKTFSHAKEKKAYKFVEKWSGFLPNEKNVPSRIEILLVTSINPNSLPKYIIHLSLIVFVNTYINL